MKKTITLTVKTIICSLFLLILSAKTATACDANFTHTNACAGDTVWFYAHDQFAVYTWDFGDGAAATNINHDTATFHVYTTPGVYYVTLFVNIGAEWDYHTQIITIGSTCFNADFTTTCGGSNYMYFYNTSYGSTSQIWEFGDVASGTADTSSAMNPYHMYPAAGSYTVHLYTTNGTMADTSTQVVVISATCITATIYTNIMGNCAGDSTHLNAGYTGTITSYAWNFGDPASGANNTSTLALPVHIYATAGSYFVTLIISNGATNDTVHSIVRVRDCTCWPGDCNSDGEVNCDDIFAIGMFHGNHSSVVRPAASSSFVSQPCADWPSFSGFMYLQDLVNMKHADANGDSTVNAADAAIIQANYGMSHTTHNNRSAMPEANATDPAMFISFPSGSAIGGSTITGTIYLGEALIPTHTIYGYSFSVLYDNAMVVPGSVVIDVSTNWLGNATNELTVTHDNYAAGHADAGVVRYDKVQLLSGYGAIGTFTCQLQYSASGTFHTSIDCTAKVLTASQFASTMSSNLEVFHPLNLVGADISVTVGITENNSTDNITVYPNPATDAVFVKMNDADVTDISLVNMLGEVIFHESVTTKQTVIDMKNFAAGIYTLNCKTRAGVVVKKISVVR